MSKMRNIILIINILNFYVYQFIAIHKKVFPTYPIEITSEKIVGLLFTILCFIIFIFIDKLYPLRVEYIFIFIIPVCLLHYYALIHKNRAKSYIAFIRKQPQKTLTRWKLYVDLFFIFILLLLFFCIVLI